MGKKIKPVFENRVGQWIDGKRHIDGRVFDIRFTDQNRGLLARYLSNDNIAALERACETWAHLYELREQDPTFGQVRAALANISDLARNLAYAIDNADPHTKAALELIGHRELRDYQAADKLQITLEVFADGAGEEREKLPVQSRKSSPIFQVKLISDFLANRQLSIKPDKNDSSPFREIVEVCFEAMLMPDNAENTIKKFIAYMKEDSPQ